MNYGHWRLAVEEFDPDEYYGFVYLVTNKTTGRQYIGKKSMWSHHRKKVKKVTQPTETKNIIVVKESDWRSYQTSSKHILDEIANGEEFDFCIISLHTTKGTLAYQEVFMMVLLNVLKEKFPDGTRAFYNGVIPGIKFLPPDEFSDESKKKMSESHKHQRMSEENKKKLSIRNKLMGIRPPPAEKKPLFDRVCSMCNTTFSVKNSSKKIFCTRRCSNKNKEGLPSWNKGIRTGIKTPGSFGKSWYTNGTINKMFPLNDPIPTGFTKGRTI